MPSKKSTPAASRSSKSSAKAAARNTASAPARTGAVPDADAPARKAAETQALAAARPFNANKAQDFGRDHAVSPPEGEALRAGLAEVGASTLSESQASAKTGTPPAGGVNANIGSLDRVRVDSGGQRLTTNQGVPIADNQNSLKAGLRGPALLEDFILREKITHFDHERIPERIVHARGSGAHGYFECYEPLTRDHAGRAVRGGRQAHAGVRALLHRGRRARLQGHRARRARLRGQVLHRRRQLGPGRQQHAGVLHPGRDEVPRPRPRGQARAAPRRCRRRPARTTPSGTSSR